MTNGNPVSEVNLLAARHLALKPCPFDGGEARPFTADGWWGVRCRSCGAQIGLLVDETKAADAWNRRLF